MKRLTAAHQHVDPQLTGHQLLAETPYTPASIAEEQGDFVARVAFLHWSAGRCQGLHIRFCGGRQRVPCSLSMGCWDAARINAVGGDMPLRGHHR